MNDIYDYWGNPKDAESRYDAEVSPDSEIISEINKALSWADMYKENTRRIRTLLSYDPITRDDGKVLMSTHPQYNKFMLIIADWPYYDHREKDYINPVLL